MATSTTSGGTTTSFSNTPQAGNDLFTDTGLTEDVLGVKYLNVMLNDLGGAAKTLYSLDDGISASTVTKVYAPADLLTKDAAFATEALGLAGTADRSLNGAKIWITADGKVGYDASTLSDAFKAQLQSLAAGEGLNDSFTYAIRLGNGTLSWAKAIVQINGVNDVALISGTATGTVTEDGDGPSALQSPVTSQSASGKLTVTDVDTGQSHFQVPPDLVGTYGTFSFNSSTGEWGYTLNNAAANVQALGANTVVHDTLTVKSADGTATGVVKVTITGTNDAATVSSDSKAVGALTSVV